MARSDTGKAIRAVAKERQGARLVGIDVEHIFAVSYGIGIACLGAAACLLMPTFYVTPQSGYAFVLVAFTIVVLGGMGSFVGAAVGGFLIGVTESIGRPVPRRAARPDRHLADLHPDPAVQADRPVREPGVRRFASPARSPPPCSIRCWCRTT